MSERILGIDVSSLYLRAVELEGDCVVKWFREPIPTDPIGEKQFIASFKAAGFVSKRAVVSLSGSEVFYQLIDLPNMPPSEVPTAINYKLKGQAPFPINQGS
jgi:Tfp pilus assembly PilM family ATPase